MADVKSIERVNQESFSLNPSVSSELWNRNYTLTGSEADTQTIIMFSLPARTQIVALLLYHDNVGDVSLSVGPEGSPTLLIASEDGSYIGTGVLGQGATLGMAEDDSSAREIVVRMIKSSGSYVAGSKIQLWAIGIKT